MLPFPLPDKYKNDGDSLLPRDALNAVHYYRFLLRRFGPDSDEDEDQLKKATDIALGIRLAWSNEWNLELAEVPLAKDFKRSTDEDFARLEQWFLTAATAIRKEIASCEKDQDDASGGAGKGEAEDLQPTSCLTSLQVIGSGQVHDGWEVLREILAAATRKVDIEDAHINADVVALLRSAPDGVAVRVLTKKLYDDADPAFRRLAKQKSGTLEVRTTADLHPRRVYVDDRAYILEDSIKDLALKTASSIVPVKTNEARRLLEDFERRWAGAGVRIRPKA